MDTGSLVTIKPPDKEVIDDKKISPITENFSRLIKSEVKLAGKVTVEAESEKVRKNLTMLITEREDIKPLLGMDWLGELNGTTRNIERSTTITDQSEIEKLFTNFEKFFVWFLLNNFSKFVNKK